MLSKSEIKSFAQELGFQLVGVADPQDLPRLDFYDWWLNQGFAAEMHYMHRQRSRRTTLKNIHPEVESVIVCALPFPGVSTIVETNEETNLTPQPKSKSESQSKFKLKGKVARYAVGEDYHFHVKEKLEKLVQKIDTSFGFKEESRSLAYVDTGAIPERSLGVLGGIGWIGKNSMLIHPEAGSWFWLGEILTKAKLSPDTPLPDRCGTCRRCLDACPTDAILEGVRTVDSRKCISYLTIEHRGEIPDKYQEAIGDWILGCDICQEVCPWNEQSLKKGRKDSGAPKLEQIPLREIFELNNKSFKQKFSRKAHLRPKLIGLQRNARIARKNSESS